jgi:hypothetical protein
MSAPRFGDKIKYQPMGYGLAQNISDHESDSEVEEKNRTTAKSSTSFLPIAQTQAQPSMNPFDDDFDLEQYGNRLAAPLEYLSIFSEKEILDLEAKHSEDSYRINRYELDHLVKEHKWIYRGFLAKYRFAISTNVPYTAFQIVTARDGIQSTVKLFKKDLEVSDTTGLVFGTILASADLAFNLNAVSAVKEAIKATLEYATRDSYKEQLRAFIEQAREEPAEAAGTVVKWAANKTVLYSHNLIGSTANILAFYEPIAFSLPRVGDVTIPALMPLLPQAARFTILAGFAYGGNDYYSLFSNPDYKKNFDLFWMQGFKDLWNQNPDGAPWLLGELSRGKVFVPLQIAIQGLISTVAIRAYPNYYYLAQETFSKIIGLNPAVTAGLAITLALIVAWHTLCARYPKTYNRYLADHLRIEALLKKQFEETVSTALDETINTQIDSLNLAMDPTVITKQKLALKNKLMEDFTRATRSLLEAQIKEAEGSRYTLKQDPTLVPQLAYRALVGLYLGYSSISPLLISHVVDEPISMTLLSMFLGTGLLTGALYQAEKARITDHLVRQKIDLDLPAVQEAEKQGTALSNHIADTITGGSNLSRFLSVLGSAKRVFGDDNALATSATFTIAAENMINTILFSLNKVRSTVSGWSCFTHRQQEAARVANRPGTLFARHEAPRAALELEEVEAPRPVSGWRSYLPWNRG